MWTILHESSIFPGKGVKLLKEMAKDDRYEFYLITARFGYLKNNLYKWLEKNQLRDLFKSISVNEGSQQPHLYKQEVVEKLKLDYYVEDNLDIVSYLNGKVKADVCWIYNAIDKMFYSQPREFPYLEEALRWIEKNRKELRK
jgi:hypothetical protein